MDRDAEVMKLDAAKDLRPQVAGLGVTTSQSPHAMPLPLSPRTMPLHASEIDRAYPAPRLGAEPPADGPVQRSQCRGARL